ncbi:MAG: GldG family protein [Bacteroidota bacterium]
MRTRKKIINFIFLTLGILVLINILSDSYFLRLDFTEDNRYTLSRATKDILSSLNEPVTITAYFSADLPTDIAKTRSDFKELLIEYENRSKGMLVYEFFNPNEDEEAEQKAMQSGIQPVIINVRDKNQVKQQKAYLGAVIQLGEQSDVIPFMKPGAAMEYSLSTSIKKLSVTDKPSIGLLQGHGEPSVNAVRQVNTSLSILYDLEPIYLNDTTPIPDRFKTIAIVAPTDTFPDTHLKHLDNFLAKGKNLFIAYNRVQGDLSRSYGESLYTGLENWLSQKGITIENNFIVDASCGNVTVMQQQGFFTFRNNIRFPFLPLITNFEEHPITKGLEQVIMQFVSSITFTGDTTLIFTPIAKTSQKTGTQQVPLYFNVQKQWQDNDFPLSNLVVGAIIEGKLSGENYSKIIVISDGNFPINGEEQGAQQLPPDNVNLMVNAIDWLSDDTGLIELRTKGITSRPLDQIEDSTKTLLKYLNFLLPIILIIIYGLVRMQTKRNLKIRRMAEDYV